VHPARDGAALLSPVLLRKTCAAVLKTLQLYLLSTTHLPHQFMEDAKVSATDSQELQMIPDLYDTRSAHRSGGRTCWSETQDASAGAGCENQRRKQV